MHKLTDQNPEPSTLELQYREILPDVRLSPFILAYWEFRADGDFKEPFNHHVMSDACVSIVSVGLGGFVVVGPRLEELVIPIRAGSVTRGVRFWPGVTKAFLNLRGVDLRDSVGPHSGVNANLPRGLARRLDAADSLEGYAQTCDIRLAEMGRLEDLDAVVSGAVSEIMSSAGQTSVRNLVEESGLSERQFQRRFKREVGITAKQFARIRRFRASIESVITEESGNWAAVAYQYGYADQAHLCREYGQLVGLTPEAFKNRVQAITHIDVSP